MRYCTTKYSKLMFLKKILLHQVLLPLLGSKCAIVFLAALSLTSFAQSRRSSYNNPEHTSENLMGRKQGWFVGADGGYNLFYGDVSSYNTIPKFQDFKKSAGTNFSLFGGKKFKFGLSAELQLSKGTLKGEKKADQLYARYFKADVMSYALSAKYNLSQLLFREKNDNKFFNRLAVYATVGGGQAFFRSRLYKYAVNNQWYLERVSGYSASGVDSAGITSAGGLVTDKAKTVSTIIIPVGGKINFKLNQKTDIILDVLYTTAFTDQLDSWSRAWSHKDRYLYTGIGLMCNLGEETAEDIPRSDRLFRAGSKKSKKNEDTDDAYDSDMPSTTSDHKPKMSRSSKKAKKEDKDLEIKLKLYELQLKLFEMQYLIQ